MYDNINIAVGGPINADYPKVYKTKFLKPGIPFSLQVTEPNTKYVIKHNFKLDSNVTIPENCILEFDGGSLENGSVIFQETILRGNPKILCEVSGQINGAANAAWFGLNENSTDNNNSNAITNAAKLSSVVYVPNGRYVFNTPIVLPNSIKKLKCNAELVYTGKTINSTAITFIGLTSADINIFALYSDFKKNNIPRGNVDPSGDGSNTNITGLKFINCYNTKIHGQVNYFNTGIELNSDGSVEAPYPGTALNTISVSIPVFNYGIKCTASNGGFVNQNYFRECMLSNSSALSNDGHTSVGILLIGDGHTVSNTDFEVSSYHIGIVATDVKYCHFGPLRAEGIKTAIRFIGRCAGNSIINGYDMVFDCQKIDCTENVGNAIINWNNCGHDIIDGRKIRHTQYMYKYITYDDGSISRKTVTANRHPYGMLFKVTGKSPSVKINLTLCNELEYSQFIVGITKLKEGYDIDIKDVKPTIINSPDAYKINTSVPDAVFWSTGSQLYNVPYTCVGIPNYVDEFFVTANLNIWNNGDFADIFFCDCVPIFDNREKAFDINTASIDYGIGNNGDTILDTGTNRVFSYNGAYLKWQTPEGFTRNNIQGRSNGRPANLNNTLDRGYRYFEINTNKLVIWDGTVWRTPDGLKVDILRAGSGRAPYMPTISDGVYEGFVFMVSSSSGFYPIFAHISNSAITWYKSDGTVFTPTP